MPFFIIFLAIPIIEIAVFIAVGEHIGLGMTLLLALVTAIIGGIIIRHQGLETIRALQVQMQSGGLPLKELFDGFCLVAAGATLITPGFVTDTIGFALLIPQVRDGLRHVLSKSFKMDVRSPGHPRDPNVIDADYIDITPQNDNEHNDKP